MEFCHNCGAENKEGNKFCIKCGSALEPAEKGFNIKKNYYFAGPLITSLIGAIMLLVVPFFSLDGAVTINGIREDFDYTYGALYPESPLFSIILLCFVALLFYGAYVSYLGLHLSETLNLKKLKQGFYGATTVFLGCFIGGKYFDLKDESMLESIRSSYPSTFSSFGYSYGLDEGYFQGLLYSGLTAGLLAIAYYLRKKHETDAHLPLHDVASE